METRYLIYKSWNGQIHASIEHGDLTTGESKIKRENELKRVELKDTDINDLATLKCLYPYVGPLEGV